MLTLVRALLPYLLIGALALVGTGGVYIYVKHQGALAEREANYKAQIAAYKVSVDKANAISLALESKLEQSRMQINKMNERLKHELTKEPVYIECIVPASGVQLLNSAIKGVPAR